MEPVPGIEPGLTLRQSVVVPFNYTGMRNGWDDGSRTHLLLIKSQSRPLFRYHPLVKWLAITGSIRVPRSKNSVLQP